MSSACVFLALVGWIICSIKNSDGRNANNATTFVAKIDGSMFLHISLIIIDIVVKHAVNALDSFSCRDTT